MNSPRKLLVALTASAALGAAATAHAQPGTAAAAKAAAPAGNTKPATSAMKMTAAERARLETLTHESATLMAHTGIAAIALDADLRATASKHVEEALKVAGTLAAETAQVNSEYPLLAAQFTQRNGTGQKNYWLPLENDKLTVRDLDEVLMRQRAAAIDEVDVQSVRLRMYLDTASVQRELRRAKAAIEEGNYGIARDALRLAQLSTFTETVAVDQPLQRVRDNLVLARELTAQQNYASARRTLQYAQRDLKAFEGTDPMAKADPSLAKLQAEIDVLAKGLESKDSSAFSRASADIGRWVGQVEGWLKSHHG
jgi:hypothetical protein